MATDHLVLPPDPNKKLVSNKQALRAVAEDLGLSVMEMLEAASTDSVVSGYCKGCDTVYLECCEPDATNNHCEECDAGTVESVLVLAGLI